MSSFSNLTIMGMGMLHSVPKMLRTCSRVVGVFGDMFLHSVPKKGVLAFRAEKGGLRRPVLNILDFEVSSIS